MPQPSDESVEGQRQNERGTQSAHTLPRGWNGSGCVCVGPMARPRPRVRGEHHWTPLNMGISSSLCRLPSERFAQLLLPESRLDLEILPMMPQRKYPK